MSTTFGAAALCMLLFILAGPMQLTSGEVEPEKSAWATGKAETSSGAKENPDSFSAKEESEKVRPKADEFGARWKVPVAPTSRKSNLLGRSSLFAAAGRNICLTLSNTYIIPRALKDGDFVHFVPIIPAIRLLQVDEAPERMAFVIAPKDPATKPTGDILYIDGASPWSVWDATGSLKAWPIQIRPFRGFWSNKARLNLTGHTETPWRILFSPDPFGGHLPDHYSRLASCSDDGTIRLWDLDSETRELQVAPDGSMGHANQWFGRQIAEFPCDKPDANGQVTRGEFAAFSPYGHWLATAYQHRVDFRSPRDGRSEFSWEPDLPESRRIMALRFDDNGNTLFAFLENAAATKTPEVKFFQYDIDERQARPFIGTHGVVDGRMIGDGQYIVTWDGSPEIVVWDVAERKEAAAIKVAPRHVYDLAISPNGDVIATAGDDGTVKFWKSPSNEQPEPKPLETTSTFRHDGVDLVQLSGDGKWLFTGSDDGWLKTWDAPEFCRDHGTRPIATSIGPGGNVTEKFPDGSLRTSKKQ